MVVQLRHISHLHTVRSQRINQLSGNSEQLKKGTDAMKLFDEPTKKTRKPDEFAEAFQAAFDAHFPEKYKWQQADFVQLAAFRKAYPNVTPKKFVEVVKALWDKGTFCPQVALTIRGHAARWAQHAAIVSRNTKPVTDDAAMYSRFK